MSALQDPPSAVVEAFLEYEQRLEDGRGHGDLELARFEQTLGGDYATFLDLVDARNALLNLVDPPPVDALPTAFGPFTLLRVIGSGGAGVVYDAYNRTVRRREAVKLLRGGFERTGGTFQRFLREASAAARVTHDHVVTIHSAGELDRKPYVAMERVDGPTVKEWAGNGLPISAMELCGRMAEIADALAALHAAGIVHRDVKPSNLMVRDSGSFVLMDFGLAHGDLGSTLTEPGEMLGTPYYMSPEQIAGRDVGPATDVYALGAALYHLLTGAPPFEASNVGELAHKIALERPPPPSARNPDVPEALDAIVLQCLEKRPEDRYEDATRLRDDLRACAAGRRVGGGPVSPSRRAMRRLASITPALIVGAVVLGLLAFGWLSTPGQLTVRLLDGLQGKVFLDGRPAGRTPCDVEFAVDEEHVLVVRVEGFLDEVRTFGSGRGPLDMPISRAELTAIAIEAERSGAGLAGVVVGPRGKVRPVDLSRLRLSTPETMVSGVATFRRGSVILGELPFEAADSVDLPIPPSMASALVVGDRVTIDVTGEDVRFSAAFEVVGPDATLETDLLRVERVFLGAQDAARRLLRGRLLAEAGLFYGALESLLPLLDNSRIADAERLSALASAYAALTSLEAADSSLAEGIRHAYPEGD